MRRVISWLERSMRATGSAAGLLTSEDGRSLDGVASSCVADTMAPSGRAEILAHQGQHLLLAALGPPAGESWRSASSALRRSSASARRRRLRGGELGLDLGDELARREGFDHIDQRALDVGQSLQRS